MKKILKILSFNIFFLIIGLILIEVFFGKWFYKSNYGSLLIPNYSISVINQPYYDKDKTYIHSWDKNGFRANDYNLNEIDILVIGGSTTAEKFIDDNHIWTKVFERQIENKTKFKVINAGIGGQTVYGHNNMFDLWFSNYKELKPKYIFIYLGINDAIKVHENVLKNILDIKDDNYSRIRNENLEASSSKKQIVQYSQFDIIIDDGSHNSNDIVKSFCNYFEHLKDDGLFIIEDLHCSYHQQHSGGIFYPISSINFFKKLVDVLNYEHWGIEKKKNWLLRGFAENYKMDINELVLDSIHSIEFVNSLCFIKKKSPENNKIGKRIVVGKNEIVAPDRKKYNNTDAIFHDQSNNPWSNTSILPEEELVLLKKKLKSSN